MTERVREKEKLLTFWIEWTVEYVHASTTEYGDTFENEYRLHRELIVSSRFLINFYNSIESKLK